MTSPKIERPWLTLGEVAEALGCSRRTVADYIKTHKSDEYPDGFVAPGVPVIYIAGLARVSKAQFERLGQQEGAA